MVGPSLFGSEAARSGPRAHARSLPGRRGPAHRAGLALWVLLGLFAAPSARAQEAGEESAEPGLEAPAAPPDAPVAEAPPAEAIGTRAEGEATEVTREQLEALEIRLREELTEQIKAELRAEMDRSPTADAAPEAPLEQDQRIEDLGFWEEPTRPELSLLELDGYFRFRYDFFADLDLDTFYVRDAAASDDGEQLLQGPFAPGFAPPVPLCNTDVRDRGEGVPGEEGARPPAASCANRQGEDSTLGGANIRFRLEPTLNVYEDIRVRSQIDILDNLVLGSTPDSLFGAFSPLAALSATQIAPSADVNTIFRDSIRVKRVWAEYMTPLGELSFGRMPNHVGMGISANDGNGVDMDFGDTVDRLQFAAQVAGFVIAPAYDWAATGATSVNLLNQQGQPFDRDQRDDVDQLVLTVAKVENPEARALKLANDEIVFDFGTQQILRFQQLDSQVVGPDGSVAGQPTTTRIVERDTQLYNWSLWGELRWRNLTVSAEYAGSFGRIGNLTPPETYSDASPGVDINQHGGALRGTYKLLDDALTLELLLVAASGDDAPGWGVFPLLGDGQRNGAWDGNQAPAGDGAITNYRFDPDFIVDLIFWRQLVGTVTDAFIVRPSIQYELSPGLGGRLDLIYSRAWFGESTPSGTFLDRATETGSGDVLGGLDNNLGVEADLTLFFRSERGIQAQFQYGIFIPMDGLDRQVVVEDRLNVASDGRRDLDDGPFSGQPVRRLNASVAHTLQVLLAVTF